jgi:hypothetical protein
MTGALGAAWGIGGVVVLLGSAIYRLVPLAIEGFSYQFLWYHWTMLVFVVLGMAYSEGYRAFQKGFSPRVAARARYLRDHPRFFHVLCAPFFCMGYCHAPKKRRITSISVTIGIVILVLLVRLLQQPWRGIVDQGVVAGLAWGLISLLGFSVLAFTSKVFPYSPEVPELDE